jgi:hypothetical protein
MIPGQHVGVLVGDSALSHPAGSHFLSPNDQGYLEFSILEFLEF